MPRRKVVATDGGYRIEPDEGFVTPDRSLAETVAAEYDRVDPLPCDHGDWIDLMMWGKPDPVELCGRCGRKRDDVQ